MKEGITIDFVRRIKLKTGCRIATFRVTLDKSLDDSNGSVDYLFDVSKGDIKDIIISAMHVLPFCQLPFTLVRYELIRQYPVKVAVMTVRYSMEQRWFEHLGYIQYMDELD